MEWNIVARLGCRVLAGFTEGLVHRVALGGDGHVDHRLGDCQLTLRRALPREHQYAQVKRRRDGEELVLARLLVRRREVKEQR